MASDAGAKKAETEAGQPEVVKPNGRIWSDAPGSGAVVAKEKRGGGWLKWLIPLLLLAALIVGLIALLGGDDDDDQARQPAAPTATAVPAPGAGASATLTAPAGALRGATPQSLTAAIGQQATGREAVVQSVVPGAGFWVGTSREDRVFVEYGGGVGGAETSRYEPNVGDKVNLTGPVRPAPEDPERTLNLPAGDAEQVTRQGAYVNADDVQGPGQAPSADTGSSEGTLTAADTSLATGSRARLQDAVGQRAVGRSNVVQSVVPGTGFWVGSSREQRVFVEYGDRAGESEADGNFKPQIGDTVDLTGEVRPTPEDPAQTLNVGPRDAQQLTRQGGYINADRVTRP